MDQPLPVLFTFRRCPYAMRARMALAYADIKLELREILLSDKPEAMLNASAKGTVPVLILDDGKVIDESLDIMLWALEQNDPQQWLTESAEQKLLTESLIHENDYEFKTHLDHYKYSDRFPQYPVQIYRTQAEQFLQKLELQLNLQPFLVTNYATLADYSILPFIRQFAYVDIAWFNQAPYPGLQKWLSQLLNSSLFHTIMEKHTLWKPGNKPIFFP